MKALVVIGQMTCDPAKTVEVDAILSQLSSASVSLEEGCVSYQYFEEIGKPGHFATVEHWANADAEAAHWKTPHLKEAVAKLTPLMVDEMRMFKYQKTK